MATPADGLLPGQPEGLKQPFGAAIRLAFWLFGRLFRSLALRLAIVFLAGSLALRLAIGYLAGYGLFTS